MLKKRLRERSASPEDLVKAGNSSRMSILKELSSYPDLPGAQISKLRFALAISQGKCFGRKHLDAIRLNLAQQPNLTFSEAAFIFPFTWSSRELLSALVDNPAIGIDGVTRLLAEFKDYRLSDYEMSWLLVKCARSAKLSADLAHEIYARAAEQKKSKHYIEYVSYDALSALIDNPLTPGDIVVKFAQLRHPALVSAAVGRPDFPLSALLKIEAELLSDKILLAHCKDVSISRIRSHMTSYPHDTLGQVVKATSPSKAKKELRSSVTPSLPRARTFTPAALIARMGKASARQERLTELKEEFRQLTELTETLVQEFDAAKREDLRPGMEAASAHLVKSFQFVEALLQSEGSSKGRRALSAASTRLESAFNEYESLVEALVKLSEVGNYSDQALTEVLAKVQAWTEIQRIEDRPFVSGPLPEAFQQA